MSRLPFHFEDLPDRDPGRPARREQDVCHAGQPRPLTVTQLTDLIKGLLLERMPRPVHVMGELSNLRQRNGHWYLSLRDEQNVIDCVVWASTARKLDYQPQPGQQVLAIGRCDFYGPQGKLQLYLDRIEPVGLGALEVRLRQLMEQLRRAGYFDQRHKKPLPVFPQAVAVITSRSGAALADVVRTTQQRWAGCRLFLLDVRVQGAEAAGEIARAIDWLNRHYRRLGIDAAILTRGGGSLEDLWCFNDPAVAEAIFRADLPIVAAIGHETDTTIAELVADLRCSTPTQAAARLIPDARLEHRHLDQLAQALAGALKRKAVLTRTQLQALAGHEIFRRPMRLAEPSAARLAELTQRLEWALAQGLEQRRRRLEQCQSAMIPVALAGRLALAGQQLDRLAERLASQVMHRRSLAGQRLEALARHLESVGPAAVLQRGYSYTTDARGRLVRSVHQVRPGQALVTHLADGTVDSQVTGTAGSGRSAPRPGRAATGRKTAPRLDPSGQGGLFDQGA